MGVPHSMARAESWESKPRLIDGQKRVALPAEVLAALRVDAGDYLTFTVAGSSVTLSRVRWTKDA